MSKNNIKVSKKKLETVKDNSDIMTINSMLLIEDDSDNESVGGSISWSDEEDHDKNDDSEEEIDEDDEIVDINELTKKISKDEVENEEESDSVNEVKFEIIKDENNKSCVKVSVSLDLENSELVNIEFCISKETFLKLAKQLK
jgi:hypothetical protein